MEKVLIAPIVSFIVSLLLVPLIIKLAKKTNFFVIPGGRKIHKNKTPSLGGIAIFAGFAAAALMFAGLENLQRYNYLFSSVLIIFITGVRDDISPLSAGLKISGQLLAAFVVVHFGGVRLTSMHGIFWDGELPVAFQYALTILTIIVITNALNLIDGIDGLAASVSTLAMSCFGLWFYSALHYDMLLFIAIIIGAVSGFFVFNVSPAKIFMGDSGSLVLGFLMAFISITFIEVADSPHQPHVLGVKYPASLAIGILVYPLFDLLRVFILRAVRGDSPFSGDKTHIHHILLRTGMGHNQTTLTIFAFCLVVSVLCFAVNSKGHLITLGTTLTMCLILLLLLERRVRHFKRKNLRI